MSDEKRHRKRAMEKRRREVLNRKPTKYCGQCTALAYAEDEACLECGLARPEAGWPDLREIMDPWLGRKLDERYLLTKRIGQGASASVYRAESMAISRQFAIKIIHPPKGNMGPSPEQIATRLEREVEALGRLRNPHIVRFYDVIELPLNHIGVVMDFVEGDTLEKLVVTDGHLQVARACTLLRQIANGVYEAHLVGMTHRDLKPENIMVEQLPAGDDFVYVLDFGIVQVEGEASMTQGFIGTPLYASPEQAMGEHIDHRSDIYSLGAIFFFMLCGRPPFVGQNVMQVLRQHVETTPPNLRELRPDMGVPDQLELMIEGMLAKDPEERPQTLAEIIHQLDDMSYSTSDARSTLNGDEEVSNQLLERVSSGEHEAHGHDKETSHGVGVPFKESSAASDSSEIPLIQQDERSRTDISGRPELKGNDDTGERTNPSTPPMQAPSSGIFGRVRRPAPRRVDAHGNNFPEVTAGEGEPTHSFVREDTQQVSLPDGVSKVEQLTCCTNYDFAFLHDDRLHVWQKESGQHMSFALDGSSPTRALALGHDSALIGRASGTIEQVHFDSGNVTILFESVFSDEVADLTMSDDGTILFALMKSGRIYISRAGKASNDWVRVRGGKPATRIALSPKGDLIAVARESGEIEVSRVSEPKQVRVQIQSQTPVNFMAFTDDGYLLGVSNGVDRVALYQVINGKFMVDISLEGRAPLAFFFSRRNNLIGYLDDGDALVVRDLQS